MKRFGVGLAGAVVVGLVACASEEVDQLPAGRGAAGGAHGGAAGRGGSSASNIAGNAGRASQNGGAGSVAGASSNGAGGLGASGGVGPIGSGGTSGTTGSAGSGGTSPVFESGVCASSPSMSLSYKQASNNPKQITAIYQFINTTDTPIPVAQLKIRYFFSNEETSGWSTMIYDAKLDGGTVGYRSLAGSAIAVSPLGATVPGADSYIEVSFSSTESLEKGAIGTVNWDLQPHSYNAPDQVQTDDYSYNAAAVAFTVWDHVVIYQGGNLVWGCTPKAADGGSGGVSGAGTGGAVNGGTGGAGDGGTSGTVNGGATSAGASVGGASGAGVGGASGLGGTAGAGGSSGAAAGGTSGSSGLGGELNAGTGGAGAGGSSNGGVSGAP